MIRLFDGVVVPNPSEDSIFASVTVAVTALPSKQIFVGSIPT